MNDGAALLQAILAFPDEDTPRLVYADWLQENGQPERAEFIRVQCRIAAWDCTFKQTKEQPGWNHNCGTDDKGYWLCQPLRFRARELLVNFPAAPYWSIPPSLTETHPHRDTAQGEAAIRCHGYRVQEVRFDYRRGFVEHVTCTATDWLQHADAIYWHPEQTVECPDCRGDGWYEAPTNSTSAGTTIVCRRCKTPTSGVYGTGRIRRPFVSTAHPIRRVTLTTEIGPDWPRSNWSRSHAGGQYECSAFPGILFLRPA